MEAMEALLSRSSVPAKLLGEPAPAGDDLDDILSAAVRAPDHGGMQPWRFILVRGAARHRLGEVFVEALLKRQPDADADAIEKERNRPLRSPLIIVICAALKADDPKVPEIEQILSAGAAAQNMLNAAHAKGYGAILLTGANAYDPHVAQALGLKPSERIVCFAYLGTPIKKLSPKRRPDPRAFVREWTGRRSS